MTTRVITFTVCGDVSWDEMSPKTQEAIRAVVQAAYDHIGKAALPERQSSYASGRERWPQGDPPTREDLFGDG